MDGKLKEFKVKVSKAVKDKEVKYEYTIKAQNKLEARELMVKRLQLDPKSWEYFVYR